MISRTATELRNGMMGQNILESLPMEQKMDKESSNLATTMSHGIGGFSGMTNSMEKVSFISLMESIKVTFIMEKCKVKACLNGKMDHHMMGSIKTIKSMDKESTPRRRVKCMKGGGKMVIDKVKGI